MFGCEAGLVFVSPNSTIDVEPVEYAVKLIKWADILGKFVGYNCNYKMENSSHELSVESEEDQGRVYPRRQNVLQFA